MGLEQVIGEVRRDGDSRAQRILDDARAEAERIMRSAQEKAETYDNERQDATHKAVEQAKAQISSNAEFEARKTVLRAEATLRQELRDIVLEGFAGLPAATRQGHIEKMLATASKTIPEGSVFGAPGDKDALEAQTTYAYGGDADIVGGIVVESADGDHRLDLSYETVLSDAWKDVLKSEAKLFE